MIEVTCGCAAQRNLPESSVGKKFRCPTCGQQIKLVCAETLAAGSGLGDFDAQLTILAGPENVGLRILLGGVLDLSVGKLPERHIPLPGVRVSREHCRLVRVNFGPSAWKIVDNNSTNGIFVNGQRVSEEELQDGDVITIGEYELKFDHVAVPHASAASPVAATTADEAGTMAMTTGVRPVCPSCQRTLPANAKICIDCGIHPDTGRPVLTRHDVDLDSLFESARQIIWFVSWIVWITPMPMPIRSEAFGTRKPYAIWTIAIATIMASITFYIAQHTGDPPDRPGNNLMLWPVHQENASADELVSPELLQKFKQFETPQELDLLHREDNDPKHHLSDDEVMRHELAVLFATRMAHGEFHWYQLLTYAFLHDTSSILNFLLHLGGNLLFLLVFGTRVNALIGNIATAILYPILAICAGAVYLMSLGAGPPHPMLGASGAIMGLAGMYLILFPLHRVFCAMWISIWLVFRRIYGYKIFPVRGFWVLLMYFGYDLISVYFFRGGEVAHWAHIGGFCTGALLGLAVLASRMFNTHGGDLLSVTLGRYAWPLIGKPSRWAVAAEPIPRATSLDMP